MYTNHFKRQKTPGFHLWLYEIYSCSSSWLVMVLNSCFSHYRTIPISESHSFYRIELLFVGHHRRNIITWKYETNVNFYDRLLFQLDTFTSVQLEATQVCFLRWWRSMGIAEAIFEVLLPGKTCFHIQTDMEIYLSLAHIYKVLLFSNWSYTLLVEK